MPRNVTVTLDDGTQHSYQNIPDDVTPDQVTQRAQKDFGKGVTAIDGGRSSSSQQGSGADVPLVAGMQGYEEQQAAQQAQYANTPANPEPSLIDKIGAIGRTAASIPLAMAGSLVAGPLAITHDIMKGVAGTKAGDLLGVPASYTNSNRTAEDVYGETMGNFTAPAMYRASPTTKEYMGNIGEKLGALDPAMTMALPGKGAAIQGVKNAVTQEVGLIPRTLSEATGALSKGVDEAKSGVMKLNEPEILKINDMAERIKSGSTENDLAPFKLDGDKVVADPHAKAAISQGWEEGTVQNIKTMDKQTTDAANEMLDMAEKGRNDKTFRDQNHPTVVIVNALEQNINFLKSKNTEAGKEIDSIANNFPKEPIDVSAAIDKFIAELEDRAHIKFPRDESGAVIVGKDKKITPDFKGSNLEGAEYASDRNFLQTTLNRLTDTGAPTPFNVHRVKKYIDDTVTWGKGNNSTTRPEIERAVKGLRNGLDDVLDNTYPDYNAANVKYRDTVTALDGLQDAAGKKLDFFAEGANQQLGTLSKRLMQNVTTRQELQNAITKLQDTSLKYGNPKTVDINRLGSFGADIESVYKNARPYSFQAQTALGVARAAHGDVSAAVHAAGAAKDFVLRRTPEKQFNTLSSLIGQQRIKHVRAKPKTTKLQSTERVAQ